MVHRESAGTYGVPRITAELREAGHLVNHKGLARVMRGIGLSGLRLGRRHRTTIGDPAAAKALDLIRRDFTAEVPNTRYVGDITYLPIVDGHSDIVQGLSPLPCSAGLDSQCSALTMASSTAKNSFPFSVDSSSRQALHCTTTTFSAGLM